MYSSMSHFLDFSYNSLATILNHDTEALHFPSLSSSFQHQEMQTIYPQQGSGWQSQHYTQQFQWSSSWQLRIQWQASSATIQECNGQVAFTRFLHISSRTTGRGNSILSYIGATLTTRVSGCPYSLRGGGWTWACATGIQEGFRFSV